MKSCAKVTLETVTGSSTSQEYVYVVEGPYTEALMGLDAVVKLGVLDLNLEGAPAIRVTMI